MSHHSPLPPNPIQPRPTCRIAAARPEAEAAARNREPWGLFRAELVIADTDDQYGVFQLLLPYLQNPQSMETQNVVKLPDAVRRELVNRLVMLRVQGCL